MSSTPDTITEAQAVAFLIAKALQIKTTFGAEHYAVAEMQVAFYGPQTEDPVVSCRVGCGALETGYSAPTFTQALKDAGENSPAARAERKRMQAAILLREADALAPAAQ